jgi:hypothetical protein
MNHRLIAFGIGLLVILTIVSGVVYWQWPGTIPVPVLGPPPVEAVPTISWTPSSVFEVVGQGQIKTVQVSFTASEDMSGVVVQVVPELQPFVQVTPQAIATISSGQPVTLSLQVSAPPTSLPGPFEGTIRLIAGADRKGTLAQPLPATIRVVLESS